MGEGKVSEKKAEPAAVLQLWKNRF